MKLEDVIHLYLGCQMWEEYNNKAGKFVAIMHSGEVVVLHNVTWTFQLKEVKPILRPLSDMTHEELQECGNMIYDFSDDPELNNHKWEDFASMLYSEQFVWLLKRGFDLFELIPSGQAISESTKPEDEIRKAWEAGWNERNKACGLSKAAVLKRKFDQWNIYKQTIDI